MADIETLLAATRYYVEAAAPSTPSSGNVVTYAKADGLMYSKDDAGTETLMSVGTALSNPMTTAGDTIQSSDGSGTPARLAIGSQGSYLRAGSGAVEYQKNNLAATAAPDADNDVDEGYTVGSAWFDTTNDEVYFCVDNSDGAAVWKQVASGSGGGITEHARVEFTSPVAISATSEATSDSVVSAGSVAFDGSTVVDIEFFCPYISLTSGTNVCVVTLYDDSSSIGKVGQVESGVNGKGRFPIYAVRRLTPSSASHTYSIRAYVTSDSASVNAGTGGSGNIVPGYIRIVEY